MFIQRFETTGRLITLLIIFAANNTPIFLITELYKENKYHAYFVERYPEGYF